jgi:hypothetical protein
MSSACTDIDDRSPLSQRIPVQANGSFTLHVSPDVALKDRFLVRATPDKESAVAPEKTFELQRASAFTSTVPLSFGDFGGLVAAPGTLKAADDRPVSGAIVYVQGTVKGGGLYRSASRTTDANGNFTLDALPSNGASFTLWAVPPSKSPAGILRTAVEIKPTGVIVSAPLVCPGRVPVQGQVFFPDGSPAAGVKVLAQPIESIENKALPTYEGEVLTDVNGHFDMALDAAVYRLELRPAPSIPALPRISRLISVVNDPPDILVPLRVLDLGLFTLSRGREVRGTVNAIITSMTGPGQTLVPADGAVLRIFRVGAFKPNTNTPVSTLVAETVADENGLYSVIVPAR